MFRATNKNTRKISRRKIKRTTKHCRHYERAVVFEVQEIQRDRHRIFRSV